MLIDLQVKGGNIADGEEYKRVFLPVRKKVPSGFLGALLAGFLRKVTE